MNSKIFIPSKDINNTPPKWYIEESTLSLGLGNPQQDDRGCYGIDLETMIVSNQEYTLTDAQRDSTLGVQVLYCVFGLKIKPQLVLQHATTEFTQQQIAALVKKATESAWLDILKMTKTEVLNKYSSTPIYEVSWFFTLLRESANYVKTTMRNHHLNL